MGLALRENRSAPSSTEHSLVAAVRAGDDAAFEELFSRYRDRISAFVHGAVSDHARAEDIAQEVFISALRRMRDTERPISFKPWIYEIARNACIDEFRRSRRATEVRLNQKFRELESGQRCERVRSAIDRSELRSPRVLGVRDRRQVARHMAYCRQCRQYAWTAGFDASSLKRRGAAQKIAALLPLGWW